MGVAGCISNVLQTCGEVLPRDTNADGVIVVPTGVAPEPPGEDEHFFQPANADVPDNLTALRALGALGQTDPWNEGEFVRLGNSRMAYWNGSDWATGAAPA